jgi:methanethiol S-methyltransferase
MVPGSFLILLAALGVYGLVHSIAASLRAKALVRRSFGRRTMRFYRLGFSLFGLASFLPVLALLVLLPDETLYRVPWPWAAGMLGVQGSGLLLFLWTLIATDVWAFLGLRQVTTDRDPERLVISGPYRYVRHPMYTASLLFLWFSPLMTWNLLALNLGVTAYFLIGGIFEEHKLLKQFGTAYAAYRARTPMFIPWPRLRR